MSDDLFSMKFRRKFCVNPYKSLRMPLMRMDFFKDWLTEGGGDPYPQVGASRGNCGEAIGGALFRVSGSGEKSRMIGQHFPYATYDMCLRSLEGGAGFSFITAPGGESGFSSENAPELRLFIRRGNSEKLSVLKQVLTGGKLTSSDEIKTDISFVADARFIVTCSGNAFDIYIQTAEIPSVICTVTVPEFSDICRYGMFINTAAAVFFSVADGESLTLKSAEAYLEAGVSHADMRSIRRTDGTPYFENGRIFLTASVRCFSGGGFQSVLSWNPSGCDFRMEGAIFFDFGDGVWNCDIASSVLYDKKSGEWYVWATAFSHGHILCHAVSNADLRHGINVLDAVLMPTAENSRDTDFLGKFGDEDPDFTYDEKSGKWYMTVCRSVAVGERNRYRYFLFESDDPFDGYTFKDKTVVGSDTGGSIVRIGGKLCFVCGSDGDVRAGYHAYPLEDLSDCAKMRFDFDDGGFRGWGTVIPVPCGSRTRYVWITFDRHRGGPSPWSYGNIYAFEFMS